MQLKTSAPGSLMLLGEYAVLYGKPALACAINKRIHVTLTPRDDKQIYIYSSLYGEYSTHLDELCIEKPFHFVLGALCHYQAKLKRGCHIDITSEFSDQVGFGSSAAITVATLAALIKWLDIKMTPLDLIRQGRRVIQLIQGVGSGTDIAASVYGGVVSYQAQPLVVEKHTVTYPLISLYAGYKTPTVEAIKIVRTRFLNYPELLRQLCNSIGQCTLDGVQSIRKEEWDKLGKVFNIQQGLMESLGVSNPQLRDMVETLCSQKNVRGAKISGAGLGDCVIGLGEIDDPGTIIKSHYQFIPVAMSLQGVRGEKI
jgi:mevalonate kinase